MPEPPVRAFEVAWGRWWDAQHGADLEPRELAELFWSKGVAATIGDEQLRTVGQEEQRELWDDLQAVLRSAIRTNWSMRCEALAHRIGRLARLVGPTPWDEINVYLVTGGIYERVLRDAGVDVEVDMERAKRAQGAWEAEQLTWIERIHKWQLDA